MRWCSVWLMASLLLTAHPAHPAHPSAATDSLRRLLADPRRPDTVRAQAAAQLARTDADQLRALRLFEQALALAPASALHLRLELLTQLAVAQGRSGDLASSLRTQQQHLALARRLHKPAAQTIALHNMAVVAEALGDAPGAIRYFEQALAVPGTPPSERLSAQAAMSQTLAYSGRPTGAAQAERLILKTLAEAETAFAARQIPRTTYNTVVLMAGRILLENDHAARGVALARRELARLAPLLQATRPVADDVTTAADLQLTLADGMPRPPARQQPVWCWPGRPTCPAPK